MIVKNHSKVNLFLVSNHVFSTNHIWTNIVGWNSRNKIIPKLVEYLNDWINFLKEIKNKCYIFVCECFVGLVFVMMMVMMMMMRMIGQAPIWLHRLYGRHKRSRLLLLLRKIKLFGSMLGLLLDSLLLAVIGLVGRGWTLAFAWFGRGGRRRVVVFIIRWGRGRRASARWRGGRRRRTRVFFIIRRWGRWRFLSNHRLNTIVIIIVIVISQFFGLFILVNRVFIHVY